jgi:hypothetical protein
MQCPKSCPTIHECYMMKQTAIWMGIGLAAALAVWGCTRRAHETRADLEAPMVYDFAARTRHARVEGGWTVLDMGNADARGMLLDGWGALEKEPDGTPTVWMTQKTARVRFFINTPRDVTFCAHVNPYSRTYLSQRLTVLVNGRRAGTVTLERRAAFREVRFSLPAEILEPGENVLTLRCRYASRRKNRALNVSRLCLVGVSDMPQLPVPRIEPAPDGWVQPPGSLVRFEVAVPRAGYARFWPRFLGGGAQRACRVWLRGPHARILLAAFDEDPAQVVTVSLAQYAGLRGSLEFEVVGPSPVEWTACRVGGHIRPDDANIYLVTLDGLRADSLGADGFDRVATPALDALARRGTVFLNAFSPTNDAPAAYRAVMSGSSGAARAGGSPDAAAGRTLAECMREADRETAAYVNETALMSADVLRRGFTKRRVIGGFPKSANPAALRRTVFAYASGWVAYAREHPQFLWLQSRYLRLAETASEDLYDKLVAFSDACLGSFVDEVERLGLDPYAAWVLTAPCGTGAAHDARVPLVVVLPGCGQLPGARVPEPVALQDLAPTLLEYVGLRVPRQMGGRSLLPWIGPGGAREPREIR